MDVDTIKFIVITLASVITTLGLAYVAARWHITVQVPPAGTTTTVSTATTTTPATGPATGPAAVTPPGPSPIYTDITLAEKK